jgi:Lrp/AsnC family transcriptional regulator, regulator for asnA, asnC and gidA
LDQLDKEILRFRAQGSVKRLVWPDFRLSSRAIAKKLGLPYGTVRDRLNKMMKSGFLDGPVLWINPSLFGLHMGMIALDADPNLPKSEMIEKLKLVDDVVTVVTHLGTYVGMAFYYPNDFLARKKVGLISALCGARGAKFTETPFPQSGIKLTGTDWKIIESLGTDAAKPYKAVAKELNLSEKTVKRRVSRMVEGGVITAVAKVDTAKLRNEIFTDLVVDYADPKERTEVDRNLYAMLEPYLFFAGPGLDFGLFVLNPPNTVISSEILERVRKLKGVESARMEVMERRIELYEALLVHVHDKMVSGTGTQYRG